MLTEETLDKFYDIIVNFQSEYGLEDIDILSFFATALVEAYSKQGLKAGFNDLLKKMKDKFIEETN